MLAWANGILAKVDQASSNPLDALHSNLNMAEKNLKTSLTWTGIKVRLADFDRIELMGLIQDLYAASKDNQTFLHARFGLGDDVLAPYKATISRWVCPDVLKNQDISVTKAKKAISDYKKAIGRPEGMAELSIFYCEEVFAFLNYCGMDDDSYFAALVRMFEQALKWVAGLPLAQRLPLLERLNRVRVAGTTIGWGVSDEFDTLWSQSGLEE